MKRSAVLIVAAAALLFTGGIMLGAMLARPPPAQPPPLAAEVVMRIPAVDTSGAGVLGTLTARVAPGRGMVSMRVNDGPVADVDTQLSARTAAAVASNITGRPLDSVDITFSIQANATVVAGPSAGAAMAAAAVAALESRRLKGDAFITGGVSEDGSITPVGGISSKARAARDGGATLLLVPEGLRESAKGFGSRRSCEQRDGTTYCRVERAPREADLGELLGIRVEEVKNVREAMKHLYAN